MSKFKIRTKQILFLEFVSQDQTVKAISFLTIFKGLTKSFVRGKRGITITIWEIRQYFKPH